MLGGPLGPWVAGLMRRLSEGHLKVRLIKQLGTGLTELSGARQYMYLFFHRL